MATAPSPFPYSFSSPSLPSAATYPQPFPFVPPTFPYAATNPYLSSASAYTTASGFSPPPPPAPTPSTAPSAFPYAISSYPATLSEFFPSPNPPQIPNHPPLAASPVHGDLHHTYSPDLRSSLPTNLCSPTPRLLNTIPTSTAHADLPYSKANEVRTFLPYDGGDTHPVLPPYICQGRDLTEGNDSSSSEILSMDHFGSNNHFVPEPSPALDLEKSNGWQPEFQQGATSDSPALHVFDGMPTPPSGYETYCHGCRSDRAPSTPIPCGRSSTLSWLFDAIPPRMCASSLFERPDMAPLPALPKANSTSFTEMEPVLNAPTIQSAAAQVQAEATISKDMPRAVLDLKRRLDEQQARDRTSFETLQGELAKLTSMAAQLAISIGKHTASATPGSSPLGIIGTASVAPKVFDTLPTPSSGYENFSGHSDQSSAVHGGGTNPKEQNLDELPQAYGLHNLNCRTVVRADGSEHSYYALPGNYTLEQDMPELLLSNKSVGVSDSNPEQQPCEEEQQVCVHPLKCLSKKIETEHTSACVSIISEVLELQPQDDGKSRNCPALKTSDPYVTRSSQFSIVCSVTETRLLWDPGDTTSYALFTTADSATNLQCANVYKPAVVHILAVQFGVRRVLIFKSAVMHCDALGLARTKVTGSALFVLVVPGSAGTACPSPSFENMAKLLWDPGILHYMAPNGCNSALQDNSFILQMAAHLSECKYPCSLYCICMMKAEYCPMRCLGEISASCMKRLQYNPGDFTHILLVLCVSCRAITDDCFAGQKLMANTTRKVAALTWHGTLPGTPFILLNSTTYTWDPSVLCIRDRKLYKYTVSSQVQFVKLIEELSLTACIQHIASNNTGLDELTSPCVGFHLQQSTKWASTSPNGITSSEYAYTMDFIIGQCKFLHKQGVQSYNAKNLLFSSNSLQILEMGIIFITFLPP